MKMCYYAKCFGFETWTKTIEIYCGNKVIEPLYYFSQIFLRSQEFVVLRVANMEMTD